MRDRVRFNRPPVVEVVCSVQFTLARPLNSVDQGLYWETIRGDFPRVEDAPPINTAFEGFGQTDEVSLEVLKLPPLRRSWFLSQDGSNLIQLQDNRFVFNWKRAKSDATYPSYDVVIAAFEQRWTAFEAFLLREKQCAPTCQQFELTYVNHIGPDNGLSLVGETGPLVDHIRNDRPDRFLPVPEGFNLVTTYLLPNRWGRLRVNAQMAIREPGNERIVRLDMTARGIPGDIASKDRRAWFDLAHEWITHGFADSTNPILHGNAWERIQ
jgi:uncharacterized protein (TIGR04255 family)